MPSTGRTQERKTSYELDLAFAIHVPSFPFQQSQPVGGRDLDNDLLAVAHAGQEGDPGAERQLLQSRQRTQSEKMCLLEKVSTSAVVIR